MQTATQLLGIGADVVDATSVLKEAKPGFTTNIKAADLASQISWLTGILQLTQ